MRGLVLTACLVVVLPAPAAAQCDADPSSTACERERARARAAFPPADLPPLPRPPTDVPLLASGATMVFVGYTAGAVTAFLFGTPPLQGLGFFPLAHAAGVVPGAGEGGGILAVDAAVPISICLVAAALEIAGAVMIGVAHYRAHAPLGPMMRLGPGGLSVWF